MIEAVAHTGSNFMQVYAPISPVRMANRRNSPPICILGMIMTDNDPPEKATSPQKPAPKPLSNAQVRARKAKQALRANLQRRKQKARALKASAQAAQGSAGCDENKP